MAPSFSPDLTKQFGSWQHGYAHTNGIQLHYVTQGTGDLVLMLHGFPEFWYSWRHQISPLAQRFRVVVPDLRGYNDSDKPSSGYDLATLTEDMRGLAQHFGAEKVRVVAHDWGGAIAWYWAQHFPTQIKQLAVLNSPHPACFRRELVGNLDQLRRSWYMFAFQVPFLPEWILQRSLSDWVKRIFQETSIRKGAFTSQDLKMYEQALEKPGSLTAALNYYRQLLHINTLRELLVEPMRQILAPTMLIWGEDDFALNRSLTEDMEGFFMHPLRREFIPDCGHWSQQEAPQTVNRLLLEFLD